MKDRRQLLIQYFFYGLDNEFFFCHKPAGKGLFNNIYRICRLICCVHLFKIVGKCDKNEPVKIVYAPLHERILGDKQGQEVVMGTKRLSNNGIPFTRCVLYHELVRICFTIPKTIWAGGVAYEWVYFSIMDTLLENKKPGEVIIAGIYDKYATWISYLSLYHNIPLTISQHGVCGSYELPHKIPAAVIEVFCEQEIDRFKSVLLNADDVSFFIKGYQTSVDFIKGGFKKMTMAVASQPGYETVVETIIRDIQKSGIDGDVIIYSHPADIFKNQNCLTVNDETYDIVHKQRFSDINVLVIINSTLAYDYLACGDFNGEILCYHVDYKELSIYHNKSITVLEPDSFCDYLNHIRDIDDVKGGIDSTTFK